MHNDAENPSRVGSGRIQPGASAYGPCTARDGNRL